MKKLPAAYSNLSGLGKFFSWYSVILIVLVSILYGFMLYLTSPAEVDCYGDDARKEICTDPVGTAGSYTAIAAAFFGFPFAILWITLAVILLVRMFTRHNHNQDTTPTE